MSGVGVNTRYTRIKFIDLYTDATKRSDWRIGFGSTCSTWFHMSWNTKKALRTLALGHGSTGSI